MKSIKFITLGCKVNQYETQAIREAFFKNGFRENGVAEVHLFVINSCVVTGAAQRKSEEFLRRIRRKNPLAKIVFTGCGAQNNPQIKEADFVIPNTLKPRIPEIVLGLQSRVACEGSEPIWSPNISDFHGHDRAFLKIQDGCDNFCAYCILPLVRGSARSRPLEQIKQEAAGIIKNGFKEIVLTGICLGAYAKDFTEGASPIDLVSAIEELEKIKGAFRIRLSSIEAKDVTDRLIQKLNSSPKLCPHLHIPFQSGDDEILVRMNRQYQVKDYLELVAKLRSQILGIAITTDIMVGFPGETDKNFKHTVEFLKKAKPSRMHIFPFSSRPATKAASFKDVVPIQAIRQRMGVLKSLAQDLSFFYRRQFLNQTLTVLVESQKDKRTGLLCGYSQNYIKVSLNNAEGFVNQLLKVKIKRVEKDLTFGISSGPGLTKPL